MKIYAVCPLSKGKALAPESVWTIENIALQRAGELNNLAKALMPKEHFSVLIYNLNEVEIGQTKILIT